MHHCSSIENTSAIGKCLILKEKVSRSVDFISMRSIIKLEECFIYNKYQEYFNLRNAKLRPYSLQFFRFLAEAS